VRLGNRAHALTNAPAPLNVPGSHANSQQAVATEQGRQQKQPNDGDTSSVRFHGLPGESETGPRPTNRQSLGPLRLPGAGRLVRSRKKPMLEGRTMLRSLQNKIAAAPSWAVSARTAVASFSAGHSGRIGQRRTERRADVDPPGGPFLLR
jgi:hypothetical protein